MTNGHCLITYGHSFPALPLLYELNQSVFRSDFCLGKDNFHTPEELVERIEKILESCGYSTARDQPFGGPIVYTGSQDTANDDALQSPEAT